MQTYNLACLEFQFVAASCGAPLRIHAEHGRSADDPHGLNRRHRLLRRAARLVVHRWVVVSADLRRWARDFVGIADRRLVLVRNGVDTRRFSPPDGHARERARRRLPAGIREAEVLVGTVGRLDAVKDQAWLLETWAVMQDSHPSLMSRCRLVLVGGGPLEARLRSDIDRLGLADRVWLAGARDDVATLFAAFDLFTLTSRAEGIPMTALEAMACGTPVLATRVGGLVEVVTRETGTLFERGDVPAFAAGLERFADPAERRRCGRAARRRVVERFSARRMLDAYADLYAGRADIGADRDDGSH